MWPGARAAAARTPGVTAGVTRASKPEPEAGPQPACGSGVVGVRGVWRAGRTASQEPDPGRGEGRA
ncbi:hypothetical protein ACG83_41135 [Frankia sp. R43]|nr:hypothetical protein ACG83_41135 [Frankia sp. R43]